jgi:hypothetical protein
MTHMIPSSPPPPKGTWRHALAYVALVAYPVVMFWYVGYTNHRIDELRNQTLEGRVQDLELVRDLRFDVVQLNHRLAAVQTQQADSGP